MRLSAIICIQIITLITLLSCQPDKNIKPVRKAVGAVWVAEPNMEYLDFALEQDIILSAIFHITNQRTPEVDTWIHFLKEAQKKGVKLRMSPIPDGYAMYLNTIDVRPQLEILSNFLAIVKAEGIKPFELILDAEGRGNELTTEFIRIIQNGAFDSIGLFIDKIPTQDQHEEALQEYQNFINEQHLAGWKVGITTLDMVVFDQLDHDNDMERILNIPLRGVDWDFITYQVYRAGSPNTSYYLYRIAKFAREEFGDKAGVDIGIMGVNQLPEGGDYNSFLEWEQDVKATRAAMINPELVVGFRLELVNTPSDNMARWFKDTNATPVPFPPKTDMVSEASINYLILGDRILDNIID